MCGAERLRTISPPACWSSARGKGGTLLPCLCSPSSLAAVVRIGATRGCDQGLRRPRSLSPALLTGRAESFGAWPLIWNGPVL